MYAVLEKEGVARLAQAVDSGKFDGWEYIG